MRAKISQPRYDHTPEEGMYFVGPGAPMIVQDADGVTRECRPGDPIPEAFGFRANRRRVMLAKHRLRFISRNALSSEVILGLVEGQTKEARAATVAELGLKPDASAKEIADALALEGMRGLASVLPPNVRRTRSKPFKKVSAPTKKPEPPKAAKLLHPDAYPTAEGLTYAEAVVAADGPEVEAALASAGLLGHFVNAARIAERDVARRLKALDRSAYKTEADYQQAEAKARQITFPSKAIDLVLKARRARKKDASATDAGLADLARCVLLDPEAFAFQPKQKKG